MTAIDLQSADVLNELFGDKEARWFQTAARNGVAEAFELNPVARVLLIMPTGVGKTITNGMVLVSERIHSALLGDEKRALRVIFVAHRGRLLTQAERAYAEEAGVHVMLAPKKNENYVSPGGDTKVEIYYHSAFGELPSWLPKMDLVIMDEGHHETMSSLQQQHDDFGDLPMVLLTATPDRLDRFMVKADVIIEPISREDAVAQGFLAETDVHTFVDSSGRDKTNVLKDVLDNYAHQMGQTLVFVRTRAEADAIGEHLRNMGFVTEVLLQQREVEVNRILDNFSEGNVDFIVNCNKLGEGIDVRGCQSVVVGRGLDSVALLNQIIGRTARPDCESRVWELVNPLSGNNIDATCVVGQPRTHKLYAKEKGKWVEREFNYSSKTRRLAE